MADRSRRDPDDPDAPDFDWLYGSKRTGGQDVGAPPGADDPTQVQRSRSRPGEPDDHPTRDPEPTRMLPTVERPGSGPSGRTSTRRPYQAPPPSRPPDDGWAEPVAPSGPGRQQPMGAPPTGRPRGRRRFRLGWLKLVLLLWVVFLVAVPLIAWSKIEKVDATPSGARPASQPGTTYLLVGSDSREGLTRKQEREFGTGKGAGRRTDTIMLLHTGSGPNLLMSIPRDSQVDVPGHGTTKINAAFAFGGPKLLTKTIENATGIRVDEYVEIGFGGVVEVVDAVGGVTICPKRAMKDKLANLDVKKGCQEADGATALAYSRSRHTSNLGDIDRARQQREVVSAVGKKVVSPWSVLNPVRYWRLNMAAPDSFAFGEGTGPLRAAQWASAMTHVNGDNGLTCGVPIADLQVNWDEERSKEMFRHVIDDDTDGIPKSLCTPSGLPRSVTG